MALHNSIFPAIKKILAIKIFLVQIYTFIINDTGSGCDGALNRTTYVYATKFVGNCIKTKIKQ